MERAVSRWEACAGETTSGRYVSVLCQVLVNTSLAYSHPELNIIELKYSSSSTTYIVILLVLSLSTRASGVIDTVRTNAAVGGRSGFECRQNGVSAVAESASARVIYV